MSWLVELDSCASTSTWALEHLDVLAHGAVVVTRRQTAGRGREGRVWQAPPGTLTCSVVLDPARADPRAVALAAGLACINAVIDHQPDLDRQLLIKWPNDVLLLHRKLAGILCEVAQGRLVVGIGLNRVAELPEALPAAATSLHQHGLPPDEATLIASIRSYLLEAVGLLGARGLAPLLPQLRARDALLGRSLSVETRSGTMHGIAGGIDEQGRLLLIVAAGGIAAVEAGHITAW
jgi:BirA family biotin operon repressor/biotin-[acetyl-CoA-carboxylase] ligase